MLTHGQTTENSQISGQEAHIAISKRHTVTNPIKTAYRALFPYSNAMNRRGMKPYHGAFLEVCALVYKRVSNQTVKRWIDGTRAAPNWFRLLLLDKLRQREAEIRDAIQALEAMPERRGIGAGLKDWWAEKKKRELDEQTTRDRDLERRKPLHRP